MDGYVTGVTMRLLPIEHINNGCTHTSAGKERIYDINQLHKMFGHCGSDILRSTIKLYGFKSSDEFDTCKEYAIAKACQKNVTDN